MKRRNSLGLITGLGSALILPNIFGFSRNDASGWLPLFSERWKVSETYTFEVFKAMPESMLSFQPTSEMMTYRKIFTHIGFGVDKFAGIMDGDAPGEEPETVEKALILDYLEDCFGHFNTAYKELEETQLYSNNHHFAEEEGWKDSSIADILLLAYNHTIHHRAQATVYLRLKEIVPPKYQF